MTEIVVFGATGQVGVEVVRALTAKGIKPRVFTRSADKAAALFGNAASAIEGDFDNEAAIAQAVQGVDSVFLASPVDPQQVTWQGRVLNAVAAARPLVVKLAGLATTDGSFVDSGRWHAETEAAIKQLELPHVFLHPCFFLQNLARTVPPAVKSGVLGAGARDSVIAPIDVRDIGEVAARLLAGEVDRTGSTLALTTDETFTYETLADLVSDLSGKNIRLLKRTDPETRKFLSASGMPEWHINILLQFNQAFRDGLGAPISSDVAEILGKRPRSLHSYLVELLDNH